MNVTSIKSIILFGTVDFNIISKTINSFWFILIRANFYAIIKFLIEYYCATTISVLFTTDHFKNNLKPVSPEYIGYKGVVQVKEGPKFTNCFFVERTDGLHILLSEKRRVRSSMDEYS